MNDTDDIRRKLQTFNDKEYFEKNLDTEDTVFNFYDDMIVYQFFTVFHNAKNKVQKYKFLDMKWSISKDLRDFYEVIRIFYTVIETKYKVISDIRNEPKQLSQEDKIILPKYLIFDCDDNPNNGKNVKEDDYEKYVTYIPAFYFADEIKPEYINKGIVIPYQKFIANNLSSTLKNYLEDRDNFNAKEKFALLTLKENYRILLLYFRLKLILLKNIKKYYNDVYKEKYGKSETKKK